LTQAVVDASGPVVIDDPQTACALVFGLRWSPLVGSRIASLARKRAVQARASHYVYGGSRGAAVGCTRLHKVPRTRSYHSAAQAFARQHPEGSVAVLLQLREDAFWLAGAHDGAVMVRTDRLFTTEGAGREALENLRQTVPALVVHDTFDSVDADASLVDPHSLWMSIEPLAQRADAASRLLGTGGVWTRLPMAARFCIAVVIGLVALRAGSVYWRTFHSTRSAAPAAISPALAWERALARFRQTHPLHRSNEPQRVMSTFRKLPLDIDGWSLTGASCRAGIERWACGARYARRGRTATNSALLQAIPDGWKVEFLLLDDATVAWSPVSISTAMAFTELDRAADTATRFGSFLQRIRPAFRRITVGTGRRETLQAPRDARGTILATPTGMPTISSRRVTLVGPLRSYGLFASPPGAFAWTQIDLQVRRAEPATLTASALSAELTGVLYERD
jgi:hypothetical protein